jgi:hypothetical protein
MPAGAAVHGSTQTSPRHGGSLLPEWATEAHDREAAFPDVLRPQGTRSRIGS